MNAKVGTLLKVAQTKAKATSRAVRVWIEGSNLELAGFSPLKHYSIDSFPDRKMIVLRLNYAGDRKVTDSKRGGKSRPIIDLHSKAVAEVFNAGDALRIEYSYGSITIQQETIKADSFGDILSEAEALGWEDVYPHADDESYTPELADEIVDLARDFIAAAGYKLAEA